MAESYRLQAAVYSLAALRAGAAAVRMEFLFLERPSLPVVFDYRQDDRDSLENTLADALAGIEQARFPAREGKACGDCPVEDLCRAMDGR